VTTGNVLKMLPIVGVGIVGVGALTTYYLLPWLKSDLEYTYKFLKFRQVGFIPSIFASKILSQIIH
jgi:hypothetical protein